MTGRHLVSQHGRSADAAELGRRVLLRLRLLLRSRKLMEPLMLSLGKQLRCKECMRQRLRGSSGGQRADRASEAFKELELVSGCAAASTSTAVLDQLQG